MKEVVDSSHRKLIRPSLTEVKEQGSPRKRRQDSSHQNHSRQKRVGPSDQTHAEAFYYVKQMQNRTPMVVVLKDGERLRGVIEW